MPENVKRLLREAFSFGEPSALPGRLCRGARPARSSTACRIGGVLLACFGKAGAGSRSGRRDRRPHAERRRADRERHRRRDPSRRPDPRPAVGPGLGLSARCRRIGFFRGRILIAVIAVACMTYRLVSFLWIGSIDRARFLARLVALTVGLLRERQTARDLAVFRLAARRKLVGITARRPAERRISRATDFPARAEACSVSDRPPPSCLVISACSAVWRPPFTAGPSLLPTRLSFFFGMFTSRLFPSRPWRAPWPQRSRPCRRATGWRR